MPNKNNDDFNLPNLKPTQESSDQEKPIIEIPKEYYEKLEKERQEKEALKIEEEQRRQEKQEFHQLNSKIITNVIFNAIVIFVLLYCTIKVNNLCIIAIPFYFILYSIIKGIKEKKECTAAISIMVGGLVSAIVTFVLAGFQDQSLTELYDYYAIASVICGFVGLIISNIVVQVVTNRENVKALQILLYLGFFVLLFGGSYFAYQKYPEQVMRYVFMKKTEIVASTEEEFIIKTLKNRYDIDFECSEAKNHIDGQNQKFTTRTCKDPNGIEMNVISTEYNPNEVLYTVQDEYLDFLFLNNVKTSIADKIKTVTGANNVSINIFPQKYCSFVGDCVDSKSYYENYKEENDRDKLYQNSKKLIFTEYMDKTPEEFINSYGFGFQIAIYGNYSGLVNSSYESTIQSVLEVLNTTGYQNKNGYEITLRNSDELKQIMYKVTGDKSDDGTFKDPKIDN